jgi:hypothetical protein
LASTWLSLGVNNVDGALLRMISWFLFSAKFSRQIHELTDTCGDHVVVALRLLKLPAEKNPPLSWFDR